jgi:ComF family protein
MVATARTAPVRRLLRTIVAQAVEAVLPGVCCHCNGLFALPRPAQPTETSADLPIEALFAHLTSAYLCPGCAAGFHPISSPLCSCCGEPFVSPTGVDHLCPPCEQRPRPYQAARAVALYDDAWRSLIQNYKYRARVQLAAPLGRLLWRTLLENWDLEEIDGIIAVPLHSRRLRSRGYNQAELLLRRWPEYALASGLAGDRDWIDGGALRRVRATPSQTGLDRQQRRDNLKAAFQVADPARVRDRRLLLVDDVFTTGATIEACARTLLDAGAATVHVLTLARVV